MEMRFLLLPMAALALFCVLFSACNKNNNHYNNNSPVAGMMAFNLAPDETNVGYTLSGNNLGNYNIDYTGYTGTAYLPIYIGTRDVRSFDYNTNTTLATITGNFANGAYYSAFLLGNNGSYRNVVTEDKLASLATATGRSWVRYIDAITDSTATPTVTVFDTTNVNVVNEPASYAHVSSFVQVGADSVTVTVNNGSSIAASRKIAFQTNKIYTLLLVGIPGSTDPAKAVQIKYIVNGVAGQE